MILYELIQNSYLPSDPRIQDSSLLVKFLEIDKHVRSFFFSYYFVELDRMFIT